MNYSKVRKYTDVAMNKKGYVFLGILYVSAYVALAAGGPYDVTFLGHINFADGLGRVPVSIMECLKDNLRINFIKTSTTPMPLGDVPDEIMEIIANKDATFGNVCFFVSLLWTKENIPIPDMPNDKIKIAFSMIETSAIPPQWTTILNEKFNAVIVPENFLVRVYKNSGVTIPIFVLPIPMYLDAFLAHKHNPPSKRFVFGMSAGFWQRKNHKLLLKAFLKKFKNNKNVLLKIHGRGGEEDIVRSLKKLAAATSNIELITKEFTQHEYEQFLFSLDCYVLLSKGEGFSKTPREALAAGIPCILSDNTAHKEMCRMGFVRAVQSNKREHASYQYVFGTNCGYYKQCTEKDVCNALEDVYRHYKKYRNKALLGREWVRQFTPRNLRVYYASLFKPRRLTMDTLNQVDAECLTTNSQDLYEKYTRILGYKREN